MDLLVDLRMPLLNINFFMIHLMYKILIVIKNHLNYLKDNLFKCFLKKFNRILLFSFK